MHRLGGGATISDDPEERLSPRAAGDELPPLLEAFWTPDPQSPPPTVESLLLQRGLITPQQLAAAKAQMTRTPGRSLVQILIESNAAPESAVLAALAQTLGLGFEEPKAQAIDRDAYKLLPPEYCQRHGVLPLRFEEDRLVLAAVDPNSVFLFDEIRRKTRHELKLRVTTRSAVQEAIQQLSGMHGSGEMGTLLAAAENDIAAALEGDGSDPQKLGNDSPIIRFVDQLLLEAIGQGASDIHVEPKEKSLKIRYRIDGLLFEALSAPPALQSAIASRLKIMANLDISERRLPQDGRIRTRVGGRNVDLRLSTLPTGCGEKCVIRILDNRSVNVTLDDLGFSDNALTIWKAQVAQPHGILLVTGPTGSGKTTTLYASLRGMDAGRLNISTVEDPIEHDLPAATQVQVHDKIGMTFAAALRALLRQDPDVVMVGEIRDSDTAAIAVQAALTGHLVLSTLHTNDAPSSITRLINVGVEPYLISSAVNAIMAQRLVRRICEHCREQYLPTPEIQEFLTMQGFGAEVCYRGRGCDRCRKTGYSGRLGIYELLVMDDALRDLVTRNPDVNNLRRLCRERGLITLREDGFQKAIKGLTTFDEVIRVTESVL